MATNYTVRRVAFVCPVCRAETEADDPRTRYNDYGDLVPLRPKPSAIVRCGRCGHYASLVELEMMLPWPGVDAFVREVDSGKPKRLRCPRCRRLTCKQGCSGAV